MLSRIRFWHIFIAQLIAGAAVVGLLALIVRFPDVARRPEPSPDGVCLLLLALVSVAVLGLGVLYDRTPATHLAVAIITTLLVWLLAIYGFVFVWINTYGT
jgi:hypothetical protein